MAKKIALTLTEDEAEIIADALDTDLESYADALKDARANGQRDDVATFSEAVARIKAVRERVRGAIDG